MPPGAKHAAGISRLLQYRFGAWYLQPCIESVTIRLSNAMFLALYLAVIGITLLVELVKPIYGVYILSLLFIVNPGQFFGEATEKYYLYLIVSIVLFFSALVRGFSINQARQMRYMVTAGIFLFFTFLSILFSGEFAKSALLLTAQVFKVMFFSIVLIFFLKKRVELIQVLRIYVLGVAANGAFALYEQFRPLSERMTEGFYRSSGFTKNANDLGMLLVGGIPIAYYLYQHEDNKYLRLLGLAGFACAVIGIFCTVSRGSLVVLIFVCACIFIKNIRQITTFMIVLIILILFFSFARDLYQKRETVKTTISGRTVIDASAAMRLKLAETAFNLWLENPLFGVGPGKFEEQSNKQLKANIRHGSAHNTYLQLLCEHGIFGLIVFIWFFINSFKSVFAMKRQGGFYGDLAGYLQINLLAWCTGSFFGLIHGVPFLWMCLVFPLILEKIYIIENPAKPLRA